MATPAKIFFENICHYIPEFILTRLNSFLPGEAMRKVRENRTIVHKLAKDLIKDKSEALFDGKGKKDVMSLLGKYNWQKTMTCLVDALIQFKRMLPKTQRRNFQITR